MANTPPSSPPSSQTLSIAEDFDPAMDPNLKPSRPLATAHITLDTFKWYYLNYPHFGETDADDLDTVCDQYQMMDIRIKKENARRDGALRAIESNYLNAQQVKAACNEHKTKGACENIKVKYEITPQVKTTCQNYLDKLPEKFPPPPDNYATQELKKARDSFFDEPNDVMPDLVKDHGNVLVYDEDEEYEKQMKEAIARSLRGGQW